MRKLEWDILIVLMTGKGLPRTDIEYIVGQRLSESVLSSLCDAKLLRCEKHLRSYYYFLKDLSAIDTIPDSYKVEAVNRLRSLRKPNCDKVTATCRCCLGHLAGRAGVAFRKHLESKKFLVKHKGFYYLTRECVEVLNKISGVKKFSIEISGKPCLDWTEREYHIGGLLGKKIMNFMLEECWLQNPNKGIRARHFTDKGIKQLATHFDFQVIVYMSSPEAKTIEASFETVECKRGHVSPESAYTSIFLKNTLTEVARTKKQCVSKTPTVDASMLK